MARGTTLDELVKMLRAEIRHSTMPAVGIEYADHLKQIIQRTQRMLYDDPTANWEFMRVKRDVVVNPGQQLYDFPTDLHLDRITEVRHRCGGEYYPLSYGIREDDYDSDSSEQDAATGYFDITGGTVGVGSGGGGSGSTIWADIWSDIWADIWAGGTIGGGTSANQITSIKIGGIDVIYAPVLFVGDIAQTASAVAAAINAAVGHPEYTAVADGNRVLISAAIVDGADANGREIVVTVGGDVTVSTPIALSGGISGSRSDPIEKWQIIDAGAGPQCEVWPLPATRGKLRFRGIRALRPLVNGSDVADLDDDLIVLWCAAELRSGEKDGKAKAALAQRRLNALKGQLRKSGSFRPGEGTDNRPTFVPREIVVR
jgi:hypothetical protein